jgi:hypothetical protein
MIDAQTLSTIVQARFEAELGSIGFVERELLREHNHVVFHGQRAVA